MTVQSSLLKHLLTQAALGFSPHFDKDTKYVSCLD